MKNKVAIIMGSQTDLAVLKPGLKILDDFKVGYHVEVVSAHRTPKKMQTFASQAQANGFEVIIAAAGGAAHLPGMVASLTQLPVIGIPVNVNSLEGLDSLLSIAQMPKGVPVATMAIDNSANGALFALRILALRSKPIRKKLEEFQTFQRKKVSKMNKNIKCELGL